MERVIKLQCFEYLVKKLIDWYIEVSGNQDIIYAAFTRLKLQKLLFLSAAINASEDNNDLLSVFGDFYAMQYGPVESDIYNAMMNNEFTKLSFSERCMVVQNDISGVGQDIDATIVAMIDNAIIQLRKKNERLIKYPAFKLVEITHKWKSWQDAYDIANALGNGSEKMLVNNICRDTKYFE